MRLRDGAGREIRLENDVVFSMLGREAPLDFFRRSGIPIRGEWRAATAASFAAFLLFCAFLYNWKGNGAVNQFFQQRGLFPYGIAAAARDPSTLLGTVAITLRDPGFYYSLAYCLCVLLFGIARIRRRRTPYVTRQTWTLVAVQWIPLFLLPYVLLPYLGHNGAFDAGFGKTLADNLFPAAGSAARPRVLAGLRLHPGLAPLHLERLLVEADGLVARHRVRPDVRRHSADRPQVGEGRLLRLDLLVRRARRDDGGRAPREDAARPGLESGEHDRAGDPRGRSPAPRGSHRVLDGAFERAGRAAGRLFDGLLSGWSVAGVELNYYHVVDIFLAGIVGVGTYFWFSGRVWCRFACPLAALMNIYARFTRFRIFAEKYKCISCNVCTSVCHQGIDVMNFANKGLPMADPQCVRCSACVQACPTGVLSFGRFGAEGLPVYDRVAASPVRIRDGSA